MSAGMATDATGETAYAGLETLVEHFRRQLAQRPAAPAMYFRSGGRYMPISWEEFGLAARRVSGFLLAEDVDEQEHVAIWAANRPEWHIADIGILSARCRPVPVYLTLSADQAGYVIGHSGSQVVFVENTNLRDLVLEERDHLPTVRRIVVFEGLDRASPDGFVIPWQDALAQGDEALKMKSGVAQRRAVSVTLDDVATLIYTSGTTGPPKAVMLTHGNVAAANAALDEFVHTTPDDRIVSYLPLAHVAERFSSEFRSYAKGHPVWFVDGIAHLGARLREVRPTMFFGVPRIWEKMAVQVRNGVEALPQPRRALARWALRTGAHAYQTRESSGAAASRSIGHRIADRLVLCKLRSLLGLDAARLLVTGAAPISPDVIRFFGAIGLDVLEEYGQTEDTGTTSMNRPGRARTGTVGQAFRGNELRIAEDGEILVRGGVVFPGYFKDPEATAEALTGGWLHTGDVGEIDADGYLRITDRKKDLIITAGGKNISPSLIEGVLQQQALIGHAVVIGDRRPFVTALLTLDADEASAYAQAHRIAGGIEAVVNDETVRAAVGAHVAEVNQSLSHVEQVKKWTLLAHDFAVGDELTPTLKVKRKVINEKYAREIDSMYARG